MYSYDGPVIGDPSAFLAIGNVMVVLKLAVLFPAERSQPLNDIEYPCGIRNALARSIGSVTEPGSLPPTPRLSGPIVLPPRFGGSYNILWLPLLRSIGFRM